MINEKDKKALEREINAVLENVACLGRDAYGEYIKNTTAYLMNKIHLADLKSDLNAIGGIFRTKDEDCDDDISQAESYFGRTKDGDE
jgi:hypothetical protein